MEDKRVLKPMPYEVDYVDDDGNVYKAFIVKKVKQETMDKVEIPAEAPADATVETATAELNADAAEEEAVEEKVKDVVTDAAPEVGKKKKKRVKNVEDEIVDEPKKGRKDKNAEIEEDAPKKGRKEKKVEVEDLPKKGRKDKKAERAELSAPHPVNDIVPKRSKKEFRAEAEAELAPPMKKETPVAEDVAPAPKKVKRAVFEGLEADPNFIPPYEMPFDETATAAYPGDLGFEQSGSIADPVALDAEEKSFRRKNKFNK